METIVRVKREMLGDFAALDRDRGGWKNDYANWMLEDERLAGRMLDIGSAAGVESPAFRRMYDAPSRIDAVDPDPVVEQHEFAQSKWVGLLESIPDIPSGSYDTAVAIMVVEHVAKPRAFLEAVFRVLRPGGVFYATTPSSHHPFPIIVRTIETMGLKRFFADQTEAKVNDYPAYYRMNSPRSVAPLARSIGFCRAEFYQYPCVHWDQYFPRPLRVAPHLYDRLLGTRVAGLTQLVMMRLDKPA